VGAEVERLSEGPAVSGGSFGGWYRRQRELRGISLFYVAARTKLSPERVREIEENAALGADGVGRATARALAHAIGADPDEAAAILGNAPAARAGRRPQLWRIGPALVAFGRTASLTAILALGLWLLGLWLSSPASNAAAPERIYKPDYVEKLLHRE